LRADAVESIVCGYLSIVLVIGLAATRILGWWWLDSVAALGLIPFIIKEAREAIRGDHCCSKLPGSTQRIYKDYPPGSENRAGIAIRWLMLLVRNWTGQSFKKSPSI
jgi:hypothetical protein